MVKVIVCVGFKVGVMIWVRTGIRIWYREAFLGLLLSS